MTCKFSIRSQTPEDNAPIAALHRAAFGPGRFARTAFRIREASDAGPRIALTAWRDHQLAGAIQLTPITIGNRRGAMLLGPLAIAPAYKNQGCGLKLMKEGLDRATALGFQLVILIGDLPYYRRAGFVTVPLSRIALPGPADPARLLAAELQPGALDVFYGLAQADNTPGP